MDKFKGFGPNLTSTVYDASFKPIDWDELSVKLSTKCVVCKAKPIYNIYKEEKIPIQWGDKVAYFLNYCLDYAVCEEHKNWVKPKAG